MFHNEQMIIFLDTQSAYHVNGASSCIEVMVDDFLLSF